MNDIRTLPHSADAEKGVISSMLIGGMEVIEEMQAKLSAEHFHIPANGILFEAVTAMYREKKPVDLITLTETLHRRGELASIGGAGAVSEIFTFVPTAANASHYLEIVKEKYVLRQIIAISTAAIKRAYEDQDDVKAQLEDLQSDVVNIGASQDEAEGLKHIQGAVLESLDRIEASYLNRGKCSGLSTGFVDLDRMTDGLKPGCSYYFAGRPAMGKSSFGVNIAEHVACENIEAGNAVAIFSVEMTIDQLAERLVCSRAQVNLKRLRDGFMRESDFPAMAAAAKTLIESKIFVDDKGDLSIQEFRVRARRAVVKHKVKLIVIDYIQRMRSTSRRAQGNRELEVAEIAVGISAMAKELKIPIIVLAQLNRDAEKRKGSRPELADLRESGSMEQEANLVGLLYRPEYYAKTDEDREALEGQAECIIAKQRNGPVGTIKLKFRKEFTQFSDVTDAMYSNDQEKRQH